LAGSDHEGDGGWPPSWDRFTPNRKAVKVLSRDQDVLSEKEALERS
jgi:hypothetical protein